MFRSKTALALAACLAGVVSGGIAAAQADTGTGATGTTGTSAPAATITVNGASTISVDSSDATSAIQASYLTALGSALNDAHAKAVALSAQVGDTLGAVENITEQSNEDGCSGPLFAAAGTAKGTPVPTVSPGTSKHKSKPKGKGKAIVALPPANVALPAIGIVRAADDTTTTCSIEADITVTYAMAPAS
jgi:acyl-coenzyme A thioesterase PaaI-like protein